MAPHLISKHIYQRFTTLSIFNINKFFIHDTKEARKGGKKLQNVIPRLSTSNSEIWMQKKSLKFKGDVLMMFTRISGRRFGLKNVICAGVIARA